MDDGTIYAVSGSSVKGFDASGAQVFKATLPAKCGNLCASGDYLFAAGYMSGRTYDVYVLKPGEGSSVTTLDAGQRAQAVAVDYDGYLYCVNSTGKRANGKKATKILRAKVADVVSLSSGKAIVWEQEYLPDYEPPSSDGNCYPQGIAVDGRGCVYIADKGSSNGYDSSVDGIYKYDPSTDSTSAMYFTSGSSHRLFTWIYDICANDYGTVAVVGRNNHEVAVFEPGSTSADAIVSAKGYCEGVGTDAAGNVYFNASNNSDASLNGIYRIDMGHVPVAGIALSESSRAIGPGESFALGATVSPADATNQDVTYASSNTSVASVDASGTVTGAKVGTATITATSVQGRLSASCEVVVCKAAQTVTIPRTSYTKTFGDAAFSLGAKTDGDGRLTYRSGDTGVASVSASGEVTIKRAGRAKITVYATETSACKKSNTQTVSLTVNKAANPLKIKAKTASVKHSKLRKKAQSLAITKVIAFTKKIGDKKSYAKASGNKKINVNKKTGKVTVKRGLKKGTYKVKVKVKAAGNANYKASTKTATFKIWVR